MTGIDPKSDAGLWKAVAASVVVALLALFTVVLPAEYGIDPTSIGRLVGFDRLSVPRAQPGAEASETVTDELAAIIGGNTIAADPGDQKGYAQAFLSDEVVIRLESLEEVEFKAHMSQGDTLLYSWEAQAPVYVDTHGEPYNYPDTPAVRYEERDGVSAGHGRITAPFDGLHGWYWLNTNETPITITLRTSGFYRNLDEIYRNRQ